MILMKLYRVSNFLYLKKWKSLSKICTLIGYFFFNSYIPASTKIGKNSKFAYGGIGVVIHPKAIIGDNCIIGQGITIGRKVLPDEAPIIGNNVYISAGARVLGSIKIGDNVIIGANSVVLNNVPSGAVVVGIPAKIIKNIEGNPKDFFVNL